MRRARAHLSYSNVIATAALFVALGGTSYAVTALPRNSVGPKQIRPNSVGSSELRKDAVRSKQLKSRSIKLQDISVVARRSLQGRQGPAGPAGPVGPPIAPLTAAVNAGGGVVGSLGGADGSHDPATGVYDIDFKRDLRACYAVASLSRVSGTTPDDPQAGEIVTSTTGKGVLVRTRNSGGAPTDLPFHLIVVC
ncbi:MAG: hypothetical protein H0V49_08600 [Nocardioidaceae bacterium]|nr:hypothetical protein [Nocardioidaceae bacterium]